MAFAMSLPTDVSRCHITMQSMITFQRISVCKATVFEMALSGCALHQIVSHHLKVIRPPDPKWINPDPFAGTNDRNAKQKSRENSFNRENRQFQQEKQIIYFIILSMFRLFSLLLNCSSSHPATHNSYSHRTESTTDDRTTINSNKNQMLWRKY